MGERNETPLKEHSNSAWEQNGLHSQIRFASHEHLRIGQNIKLAGIQDVLTLPNGLELSFGEILTLAGDFYGVPDKPIIDPTGEDDSDSSRRQRFMEAYGTLGHGDYRTIKQEVDQILEVLKKGMTDGESEDSLTEKWDKITGGYWFFWVPVKLGRVMKLADRNYDHFLPYAKHAYLVGHKLAVEKAKEASRAWGDVEKRKTLHEAYSIDAFACHFLSDIFASGHERTPRYHLEKCVTVSNWIGCWLCKYMHDEDNKYGLHVTNKRGDKWIAYGDGMLLTDKAKENYKLVVETVQASVDGVYEAFKSPEKATDLAKVVDLIPFVDDTEKNNFPMFQMAEDGKVVRREDLENLNDPSTISNWTAVGTVYKLWNYKPKHSSLIG